MNCIQTTGPRHLLEIKNLLKISPLLDKNTKKLTKSFADNVLGRAHGSFDFCAQQGIYAPADESVAAALAGREFHSVLIALRDVAFAFPLGQTEQLGNFLLLDAKRKVERRDAVSVTSATTRAALSAPWHSMSFMQGTPQTDSWSVSLTGQFPGFCNRSAAVQQTP